MVLKSSLYCKVAKFNDSSSIEVLTMTSSLVEYEQALKVIQQCRCFSNNVSVYQLHLHLSLPSTAQPLGAETIRMEVSPR